MHRLIEAAVRAESLSHPQRRIELCVTPKGVMIVGTARLTHSTPEHEIKDEVCWADIEDQRINVLICEIEKVNTLLTECVRHDGKAAG